MALVCRAAEEEATGALQTMVHHLFVLGTLPVGLLSNTFPWLGSGALTFWTEITGPSLNMIWILRTMGYADHWMCASPHLALATVMESRRA